MSEHETGQDQVTDDAVVATQTDGVVAPQGAPADVAEAVADAPNGESASAAPSPAEDDDEELTWEQRVERLTQRAATLEGEAAADLYIAAIALLDRKDPGDFQISELWGDALGQVPGQARHLWHGLNRRISSAVDVWEQISMAHEVALSTLDDDDALAVSETRGWVQLLRSGELEAGKARLATFAETEPSGLSARYLAGLEPAEQNNWRKSEQVLDEALSAAGVSDESQRTVEGAHLLADLCMGMNSLDRAVEVLRRTQRKYADDEGLRDRLTVLYRDTEKWNAYVDLLKQAVEASDDLETKKDLFLEMVRVYGEEMNLDAMVVKTWEMLLEADPGNSDAIESLASAYESSRRWPDLISLLQAQAEGAVRKKRRLALNLRIARTYLEKLSRHVDAIKYFEVVLEVEPSHPEALEQLKDLYERRREWEKLIEIHMREIESLEVEAKVVRLKEVADIATNKLRKPAVACEIWSAVLSVAPGDSDALDALEQLYEREKNWEALTGVLERKAELESDADARSKLYQKTGALFGDRLGDNQGAIRAWRKVLEIEPEHHKGVDSLRKLLIAEKAWDDLIVFYAERDAQQDLVRVLETLANTTKDSEDAVELRFRAADVWQHALETVDRAIASLERVFEIDAQNARAAERLAPFYEEAGDWAGLARMLEIQHAAEAEPAAKVGLAMRLAALKESQLGDADAAFGWYTRAIAEAPSHVAAYEGLERVGAVLERQAEVVDIYNAALERVESDDERRELELRSGAIMADDLGQVDEALAIFEQVLEVEPENLRALGSLERILERTGRFDELIEVNERRMRLATEPAEQAEILLSGARIHEFQRDDVATAMAAYERVRELVAQDPRPLVELHRLYRQEGKFESLANVLRARLGLLDIGRLKSVVEETRGRAELDPETGAPVVPEGARLEGFDIDGYPVIVTTQELPAEPGADAEDAVALWFELGQVAQTDLHAYDEAIDCYEKITLIEPEHDAAREALEQLLEADVETRRIALILEPVYAYEADHDELVRVLGVQLETSRAVPEQIDLLVRIGRLQREELGDQEAAFTSLSRALSLAPHDESVRDTLAQVAEALEGWDRLAGVYETIVDGLDDAALQTAYDLYLAEVWEHRLGDETRAREYGRRALERGGSDGSVLDTLEALYMRTEAWRDLLSVLDQKVAQAGEDAEAVRELKLRKAGVLEEMLGEKEKAVEVYLGVLAEHAGNSAALDALDRLYADLGLWDEAAANLGRRLELAEGEAERDAVNCRLARVLHEHLGESERATEIYRDVMGREHEVETAVADLERMLEEGTDALAAEMISELLLPLYDARDDWEKRAWADEMLLKTVEDPGQRVALLHEIAKLHEEKGQSFEEAFVAYARAFKEGPDNELTLEQLYRYAEALDVWSELVHVMQSAASEIADAELAKETQIRVARVFKDKLGDLEGATAAWEKASEYAPEDGSILDALEDIYREQQGWEPLAAVLVKKSVRAEDPDEKKGLLFQAALICEEMLEEVDRAIEMYQEVLAVDPDDVQSVDSLERLYMSTERWHDLMAIYAVKVERAVEPEAQKELHYVQGALQVRELDDPHGAIETYRRVLEIDPDDGHALEALDGLYTAIEDWMSLLEILEREEAAVGDPDLKLTLRYRQGQTWHRQLESPQRAIEVYRSLLEIDAAHEETLAALEAIIAESDEHAVEASEVLQPVYEGLAEWDHLVAVYEVMIRHADEAERRIELLDRVATIREDMQGNAQEAFVARMRALREDAARDETWEHLERIGESYELWEPLVDYAGELLGELDETMAQITVASRLARIYEARLGDFAQAIEMWKRVLEIDPIDERAIKALDGLYERQQQFPELADILRREIELTLGDDEQVIGLRLRLGVLYESFLEDVPEAIANYNEILLVQPGHGAAVDALRRMFEAGQGRHEIGLILEPFYRETEQWAELVGVALALVESLETADERYQKLLDIADIFTGPLENPDNALVVYGQALAERPGDEMALARIEELAEASGNWDDAVAFFQLALQRTEDPLVQRELYWHIALGFDHKLADYAQAEDAYRAVLELNPEHLAAWESLDRIYQGQARWEDLVEVLKREILNNEDTYDQIGLYLRLGQAQYEMLEDAESAIASFREVTALEPTNQDALAALERIHFERQEWQQLYDVYGQQATVAMDDATRAEIWSKMANLASEVLERPQEAVELWYQVLDARNGVDMYALQALETLFERDGRWADMADAIERQVAMCETPEQQVEVYRKLGRIWEGPLENDERALHYWRQGLEASPYDLETLRAIKRIDEVLGDYEDLVQIIRRIVALGVLEHDEQLAHTVQLGEILTQVLMRPEEAIETWIQVLQLDPGHLQALNALEQLYVDQGAWESAVDVLDRKAEVVESAEESIGIRMQIAELWEVQVMSLEQAAATLEQVIDMDPGHQDAFVRLEDLYSRMERWQGLLQLYIGRAEVLATQGDVDNQVDKLRRAAAIAEERMEEPEMAFIVLQSALAANWRDETIASEFERLAEVTGNWRELISLYEGIIGQVEDPNESLSLHNAVARWYFHKLNDANASWQHFQFVLQLDPNNRGALKELAEIYIRLSNWQELVNVQVQRAELSQEPEDRVELYTQVAQVWEDNLDNLEQSIAAWRKVLEIDEGNLNALDQLERIFQREGSWQELVDVLKTKSTVLYEPEQVVRLRYRIGELWESALDNEVEAIAAYRLVLEADEMHRESLDALVRLFTRLGRYQELIGVYELQLNAAQSDVERIALYTKMATVYEEEFQDVDNAIACMQRITMIDPANLMAIGTLERLFRDHARWPDLVDVLQAHISVVDDPREQLELFHQLGEVFRDQQQDVYRAIECFHHMLELDPGHQGALAALADLFEYSADWISCIETLERLVGVVSAIDPQQAVALKFRIGRIYEQQLSELDRAEENYQIALDLDASYMPAIDALQNLYMQREDWPGHIRMLKQKVEYTRDLDERADLLCLIGQIYDMHLGDSINAIDYYEQTLQLSPNNIHAGRPLAGKYIREHKWARAETLLDVILPQAVHRRDVEDVYELQYWMGVCCQELGQDDKALRHFREAYELNPSHLPTLLGMGRQLYKERDYERAFTTFQNVLHQYGTELSGEQLEELYFDSAQIKRDLGDTASARQMLEQVLELNPTHEPTLNAMIELSEAQDDWQAVVYYKRHRMNVAADQTERFAELVEIADILREQIGDMAEAVDTYRQALDVDASSKFVLLKLLDIYTREKDWPNALSMLERLCEIETSEDRLSKFFYTMAIISRDETGEDVKAVEFFNKALDHNVNELRAFEAIDRILTAMKDWRELERNYRKMIKRVYDLDEGQFEDTKFLLWYGLAEIYRTRLTEWDSAISAFQQATALRPKDPKMHRILAELFVRTGTSDNEAIREYRTLINMGPDPTDPYANAQNIHERNAEFYHNLFKLYLKTKSYDQAWCVANVMTHLGIASDEETQFNERYLGPSLVQAQGRLTPENWKLVYHPEENLRIGNVMNVMQAYCRDLFAYDLKKDWGLKRKDELDQNADFLFCKMYRYLAQAIGVIPAPKLYLKRDQPIGLINGNIDPPGFIVGADMMQGRGQRELSFIIARQLSLAAPVHYLGGLRLPTEMLKTLMMGAIQANTNPEASPNANIDAVVKAILKMPPPVRIDLGKIMKPVLEGRVQVNMSAWLKAIDHTCNRVGLLLCGDMAVAMQAIRNDPAPISKLSSAEKELELVKYAISDEFFEARKRLGLSIA